MLTFKNRLSTRHRALSPDMVPDSGPCFFELFGFMVNVVLKGVTIMKVDAQGPQGGTNSDKRHFLQSRLKGFFSLLHELEPRVAKLQSSVPKMPQPTP